MFLLPVSVTDRMAADGGMCLSNRFWNYGSPSSCAMEFVLGRQALAMTTQTFVTAIIRIDKILDVWRGC